MDLDWDRLPKLTSDQKPAGFDQYGRPWAWVIWDDATYPTHPTEKYSCLVALHDRDRSYNLTVRDFAERARLRYGNHWNRTSPFNNDGTRQMENPKTGAKTDKSWRKLETAAAPLGYPASPYYAEMSDQRWRKTLARKPRTRQSEDRKDSTLLVTNHQPQVNPK